MTCNSRCISSITFSLTSRINTSRNNTVRITPRLTLCSNLSSMKVRINYALIMYRFIISESIIDCWNAQWTLRVSSYTFSSFITARILQEYSESELQSAGASWNLGEISLLPIAESSFIISNNLRRSYVYDEQYST